MTSEALIRYLEEKYGGEFTLLEWGTETMYSDFREALVSAAELGGASVTARVFPDGSVADNYLAVKYRAEVQDALAELAEPIFGPVTIENMPNRDVTESPPADTSFAEYISRRDSAVTCAIYTKADPARRVEDAKALRDAMEKARFLADIDLHYLPAEASKKPEPLLRGRMELGEDYSVEWLNWRENDGAFGG